LTLDSATPLYYRAGQFVNLRCADGLVRSYSLASVPRLDDCLDIHVKRLPRGRMSNWIFDDLAPGDSLDVQGPNGECFYVPGRPETPLLLIGNGSGLAPLLGIARDALASGHESGIHLYHGSRHPDGLYLDAELRAMDREHDNFTYHSCVSGEELRDDDRPGRAEAVALGDHPDLKNWRIYLCGYPPMVAGARKKAYLMGANLADIYADPFELQDLRTEPRD
jgi:NAD(P)H-flavin reductase